MAYIVKTCYFHLRNIGNIRNLLSETSAATLMRSLVLSRLDYCNSLLAGVSAEQIHRLQRIQNTAARIATRSPKDCHVTPLLKNLHWLPVHKRIDFKVLVLTYQCVKGTAPEYLCDLVTEYHPTRSLRSSSQCQLVVPPSKMKTFGDRSFARVAADHWNSLPENLKSASSLAQFKRLLKTHLF